MHLCRLAEMLISSKMSCTFKNKPFLRASHPFIITFVGIDFFGILGVNHQLQKIYSVLKQKCQRQGNPMLAVHHCACLLRRPLLSPSLTGVAWGTVNKAVVWKSKRAFHFPKKNPATLSLAFWSWVFLAFEHSFPAKEASAPSTVTLAQQVLSVLPGLLLNICTD